MKNSKSFARSFVVPFSIGIIGPETLLIALCCVFSSLEAQSVTSSLVRAEPATQGSKSIRVLSYNIHHGEGVDGKLDLERIAKVIQSVEPDIVSLQEVDRNVERTKKVDQPAELGRLLKMTPIFEKNIDLQGGEYGNAILTRLPVLGHRNEKLPGTNQGEGRGVLMADIMWEGSERPLMVMSTHFDHRPDPVDRIASAYTVNELVTNLDRPVILLGDLNATTEAEPLQVLLGEWTNTTDKPLPTIPVKAPSRQIDFILLGRSQTPWKTKEIRVLDEKVASDHRPIFAVVEIPSR